ncbi:MAG: DNA repair protein RadA [Gammaproteobacteria bacterium]|nr:DNA repair protein RadA [Gammaproteobacteria bacterium]
MAKMKIVYVCNECGSDQPKWSGQCPECSAWNTMAEFKLSGDKKKADAGVGYAGSQAVKIQPIKDIKLSEIPRIHTGMDEFDRVLGGGLVPGSVVLIGGDPGVGKSSILLQVMAYLSQHMKALYVTGEESAEQVAMRAQRMDLACDQLEILTATEVDTICSLAGQAQPKVMVIDSIQTMYLQDLSSAAGGVSQVRESAAKLTRFAKETHTAVILVGHVTKTGEVAGPRVLEHIVDAVVYLEGSDNRYRVMRAVKNRFGAVNELGVFAMTDKGMREVKNPSAIFLNRTEESAPGSVVMIIWEGSRPMLVELQALVDDNQYGQPKRLAVGYDQYRLNLLLAVMHRHAGVFLGGQDVFVNVVGGIKVMETSADLPLVLAMLSSFKNKAIPQDLIAFGEVGLSGEIRPVANGQDRLHEAVKHGFKRAIVPAANVIKGGVPGLEIIGVKKISEALQYI